MRSSKVKTFVVVTHYIQKLCFHFPKFQVCCFFLLVTGDWIDIAEKRPTSQSSTQTHYLASHAVDGNSETCSRTRHLVKQMWRVDLETRVWVVSVKILTRRRLSNVDIRIGKAQDNSERISMYKPVVIKISIHLWAWITSIHCGVELCSFVSR